MKALRWGFSARRFFVFKVQQTSALNRMQNAPMQIRVKSLITIAIFLIALAPLTSAQTLRPRRSISTAILVRIIRAEDERRWDGDLLSLLTNRDPAVRARAALAAGRIGNEGSLAELSNILGHDKDQAVREMAAFAIGEVESLSGANALLTALKSSTENGPGSSACH